MGREEHCKQILLACVGRAHNVWTILGFPQLTAMCFPGLHYSGSRVLCRALSKVGPVLVHFPGLSHSGSGSQVLHKGTDSVGHAFFVLPRSEQLRQAGVCPTHCPRWSVHLNHLPGPSHSVSWVYSGSTVSGVPCVSSGELISGCDPPGRCQR